MGHGAEVSKEVARSFDGILGNVARTGDSVRAIASATEAQRSMACAVSTLITALTGTRGSVAP